MRAVTPRNSKGRLRFRNRPFRMFIENSHRLIEREAPAASELRGDSPFVQIARGMSFAKIGQIPKSRHFRELFLDADIELLFQFGGHLNQLQ